MLKTGFGSHIRFSLHSLGGSGGLTLKVELSILRACQAVLESCYGCPGSSNSRMDERIAFKVACIATVDAAFTPSAAAKDTQARNCGNDLAPLCKRQQMDDTAQYSFKIIQVGPASGSGAGIRGRHQDDHHHRPEQNRPHKKCKEEDNHQRYVEPHPEAEDVDAPGKQSALCTWVLRGLMSRNNTNWFSSHGSSTQSHLTK